jgi:hypothetical protein
MNTNFALIESEKQVPERRLTMPDYRMTFGRNDEPTNQVSEFSCASDELAIAKFIKEKAKPGHSWDSLHILDRIDVREKTTRIDT